MSYGDGEDPALVVSRYNRHKLGTYYYFDGDEICCEVCGRYFETEGELRYHKNKVHNIASVSDTVRQWDHGQLDLQNGVSLMWSEFMREHDLPRVVFTFDDSAVKGPRNKETRIVPFYYENLMKDMETGEELPGIVFPDGWVSLDYESKGAMLGHIAAHVENRVHGLYDIEFNGNHTKMFRRTAKTYGLAVSNVPKLGYNVVTPTKEFLEKHRAPLRLMSRYHRLELQSASRSIRCSM